jgi:hypothetical protein
MKQNKEAQYYIRKSDDNVECLLCPHDCVIQKNKTGICGARTNIDGRLISIIYGEVTAVSRIRYPFDRDKGMQLQVFVLPELSYIAGYERAFGVLQP